MRRAGLFFLALALLCSDLALPSHAEATFRRGRYRPGPGPMPPGWDWWRIYPWSPYNYGRNPYNPAVVGYPYIVPTPYPVYSPMGSPS
jgi:hypothetical protein